jgi:hypothetical protein
MLASPEDNQRDPPASNSAGTVEKSSKPETTKESSMPDKLFKAEMSEAFEAGKSYGSSIRKRFTAPTVDDPGLPYADALTSISATLLVAGLSLSGLIPPVTWLQPAEWMPAWRALPYIPPALVHGTQLATCWTLGALAANAYERAAFCADLGTSISRTLRAGAFATGMLLLGTQIHTYLELSAVGLEPFLGASREVDVILINIANSVVIDVLAQASSLTAFRIYRWWDAQAGGPMNRR